jgi:hypothetical protein
MKYKFRAECLADVVAFFSENTKRISEMSIFYPDNTIPDVEVTMESQMNIGSIIKHMGLLEDCHVMWQTVMPEVLYTGERNYDIHPEYPQTFPTFTAGDLIKAGYLFDPKAKPERKWFGRFDNVQIICIFLFIFYFCRYLWSGDAGFLAVSHIWMFFLIINKRLETILDFILNLKK